MFLELLLISLCHLISISLGLSVDNSSLMSLLNISDLKLEGLGFINVDIEDDPTELLDNPFLPYLSNTCKKITKKGKSFSSFPKFQKIYSNCQKEFRDTPTCFATCVLYGIITKAEYYGYQFTVKIKTALNLYRNDSTPFPHLVAYDFHTDNNIFCFSKEYRPILMDNIVTCKLLTPHEFCILDEEALYCDPHLDNCNFDEREASVITSGNTAHLVTCGTLDTLKWNRFENSSKMQCILQGKKQLMNSQRQVFKDCHVCSNSKDGGKAVIEFPKVPTKEEFSKVVYSGRPIIIRNGTTSEGIPPLNFSILKEIYQDFHVGDWQPCKLRTYYSPFDNFSHALSKLSEEVVTDLYYMCWGICDRKIRKRFGSFIKSRLSFLPDDYPRALGAPWVFITSPGDGVSPHYDYFRDMTWQAQLSGSKRWRLGPPPECNHVCKELFEVVVNKGDFFLIYTNTWIHGVSIEVGDPSLVIAIEYEIKDENLLNPK